MTCHEDNCPALCREEVNCCADSCAHDGIILPKGCDHIRHKCSCQGPALLKELLGAAAHLNNNVKGQAILNGETDYQDLLAVHRLDAALAPFKTHSTIKPVFNP